MRGSESLRQARDDLQVRFWHRHVYIGILLYAFGTAAVGAYLLTTPAGMHRGLLMAMCTASFVLALVLFGGVGMVLVPTRWRSPFFVSWSAFTIGLMASGAWLDGGVPSPITWMIVLPVVYAALAYPPLQVLGLGIAAEASFVVLAARDQHVGGPAEWLTGVAIGIGALLSVAGAWNRAAQDHRVYELATHDGLTGCLNHRAFMARLAFEAARAARYGVSFSVVMADVDRFKDINDRYGHTAGDDLLRRVGDDLRSASRALDAVGRLGGDEFAVLLPETDGEQAAALIERMRVAIELGTHPMPATVSFGVATASDGDDSTQLLRRADRELYAAKRARKPEVEAGASKPRDRAGASGASIARRRATGVAIAQRLSDRHPGMRGIRGISSGRR